MEPTILSGRISLLFANQIPAPGTPGHTRRPSVRIRSERHTERNASNGINTLKLKRSPRGWSLLVDELDEPAWTVTTRRKAIGAAVAAARDLRCRLVVERWDGSILAARSYAGGAA